MRPFFSWYNNEHYHSGLNLLTPASVHAGAAPLIRQKRQTVMEAAFATYPARFRRGEPQIKGAPPKPKFSKIHRKLAGIHLLNVKPTVTISPARTGKWMWCALFICSVSVTSSLRLRRFAVSITCVVLISAVLSCRLTL